MEKSEESFHKPVLLKEAIDNLNIAPDKRYIDATVGGAGHTREILRRGGVVLGIDCDPETITYVKSRLESKYLTLVQGNFKDLKKIAERHGFDSVAGILFDLGLSSWQIEKAGRGFSYLKDEPLDMRMDTSLKVIAADLVNKLRKEELDEIFTKFGEEINSRAIARAIFSARPVKTTGTLADLVGKDKRRRARIFQALRIAVNREITNLKLAVPQAIGLLKKRGRLVVISFHSLEDRVVKFGLRNKNLKILTRKPIRPSNEEIEKNPRARSAKMRVAEKK